MLELKIKPTEIYDSVNNEFVEFPGTTLRLEHSLVSVSKWEAKYCKPFLNDKQKTQEETLYYIYCMCLDDVSEDITRFITNSDVETISNYISAPMTATTFTQREGQARGGRKIVTSEEIYYYMVALQIPFECQYWHLNRLMTLIHVCSIKNQPPKKMGKRDIMKSNTSINAARRKALHSSG